MEFEMTIKPEEVAVEDVTGRRFKQSTPSTGYEVISKHEGEIYTYGWSIDDPDSHPSGVGPLGPKVDIANSLTLRKPIILEGFGEWLPEVGEKNV